MEGVDHFDSAVHGLASLRTHRLTVRGDLGGCKQSADQVARDCNTIAHRSAFCLTIPSTPRILSRVGVVRSQVGRNATSNATRDANTAPVTIVAAASSAASSEPNAATETPAPSWPPSPPRTIGHAHEAPPFSVGRERSLLPTSAKASKCSRDDAADNDPAISSDLPLLPPSLERRELLHHNSQRAARLREEEAAKIARMASASDDKHADAVACECEGGYDEYIRRVTEGGVPTTLRGINIQQPWAGLIVAGGKTIEARRYPLTTYRGEPLWLIETPGSCSAATEKFDARIVGVVRFDESKQCAIHPHRD